MKKVAIFVDQLHTHGGIEKLVAIKANYWATQFKYDVSVVSTENKNQPLIYELDPRVHFIDLKINYKRLKSYFSIQNLMLLVINILKVQKYILKEKPDFIVVASHIPITYILPFLILRKTKIIKEFHFTKYFYTNKMKGIKLKLLNFIEAKYDKLVVLSAEESMFYKSQNIEVIPNPVIINSNQQLKKIASKELIAVSVVRFAPVKRLELLVEIWDQFSKVNSNWKLLIYGTLNNIYANEIVELVKTKKLEHCIIFMNESSHVFNELNKSRVVLITSEQECFPMVILEANSVGVPVIAFDCPTGPRNIINSAIDGLLVENNNIEAFVTSLFEFSTNESLQKKIAKNAYINSNNYNLEHIMNLWNTKIFNS
ncbi:glycosyltransferase involved in cell wall biosynthesis [Lutibacter oceani]|uniref:Glycosyltransferase involved in cell wall biosynthesis n=1 Tax=Lutibacter oceani TaxID=1853311 RepID=A0A3D9RSY8_9FLAO|nr:glycosyltransferase [Lutibacter oceani]REE83089.1 glycosyltransferase involved in cell wall biosynthesis [Lutibacter oceani]